MIKGFVVAVGVGASHVAALTGLFVRRFGKGLIVVGVEAGSKVVLNFHANSNCLSAARIIWPGIFENLGLIKLVRKIWPGFFVHLGLTKLAQKI